MSGIVCDSAGVGAVPSMQGWHGATGDTGPTPVPFGSMEAFPSKARQQQCCSQEIIWNTMVWNAGRGVLDSPKWCSHPQHSPHSSTLAPQPFQGLVERFYHHFLLLLEVGGMTEGE